MALSNDNIGGMVVNAAAGSDIASTFFDCIDVSPNLYKKGEYIESTTGNKISHKAHIFGDANVFTVNGNTVIQDHATLRGDLSTIKLGRNTVIGERSVVRPSSKRFKGSIAYFPQTIGSHVIIGSGSVVEATSVGDYVIIGSDCVVGERSAVRECSMLLPGTVLAPDTVVAPLAVFGGNPGRMVGTLPECAQELIADRAKALYESFSRET